MTQENSFAQNKYENISIEQLKDVRGENLSNFDLSKIPLENLVDSEFDTETKWPPSDRLPAGFKPKEIIENGKNPGLGILELHKMGIDGSGIHVAIIDQNLDREHEEYKDSLVSFNTYGEAEKEEMSLHGPAVAGILCGKKIGIAPGAKLHYFNVPAGGPKRAVKEIIQSIKDIIEFNKNSSEKEKIRIINHSASTNNELNTYIKLAEESGIIFIDSNNSLHKFNIIIGGSETDKENFDEYKISKPVDIKDREELEEIIKDYRNNIIVPSDYRTIASSWNGYKGYEYGGSVNGLSWSMPYLSGVFAMALQVNPSLSEEKLIDFLKNSCVENKSGEKVINPKGIIELAKKSI